MEISNEIHVGHTDPGISALLDAIGSAQRPFSRHFSQGEDFFLELGSEFSVPSFPIHHDVRQLAPSQRYRDALAAVMEQIVGGAPQVFAELTYFFDPAESLRPGFYRIYSIEDNLYLYILRIDLMMRPAEAAVVERGTNDTTPHYRTRRLFLEPTIIPLAEVARSESRISGFRIRQTISQTWIGEFGRGYFQQGIWMDADLTRFFSKLFLPPQKKTYPYFPYLCKYKTVCEAVVGLSPQQRSAAVPLLHQSLGFLVPVLERIQEEMKNASFSEDMPIYKELREKVPPAWFEPWRSVRVQAYLNSSDMKEFLIED